MRRAPLLDGARLVRTPHAPDNGARPGFAESAIAVGNKAFGVVQTSAKGLAGELERPASRVAATRGHHP